MEPCNKFIVNRNKGSVWHQTKYYLLIYKYEKICAEEKGRTIILTKIQSTYGRPYAKSMSRDQTSWCNTVTSLQVTTVNTTSNTVSRRLFKPDDQQGCRCHLPLSSGPACNSSNGINTVRLPAKLPNSHQALLRLCLLPVSSCLLPPPLPSPPGAEASPAPSAKPTLARSRLPGALPGGQDGGDVGAARERRRQRQRHPCGDGSAGGGAHQPHGDGAAHRSVPVLHGVRVLEGREARRPSRVSALFPLAPLSSSRPCGCALFSRVRRLDWIGGRWSGARVVSVACLCRVRFWGMGLLGGCYWPSLMQLSSVAEILSF